jgi:hypothetical protein
MITVKAFAAGFLSTLLFHQGLMAILHASGATPRKAYSMDPTAPFQIPQVLSLAFWGGVWGILLWLLISRFEGPAFWLWALAAGAIAPTIVALFVVLPLKGLPAGGGWEKSLLVGALMLNGAWGLGVAFLMRLFERIRPG